MTTTIKSLVSVIILTYNSSKFIEKCVYCVDKQDYENFEIIIVDNNSTDNTRDILVNIKTNNLNCKIILNGKNIGYNMGNQVGIENSNGEFIAFVNPDSFLEQSWISNIMKAFKKNKKNMIVSGVLQNSEENIQSMGGQMDIFGAVKQREINSEVYFYATGAAVILKKELLEKIKLDPNLFLYYDDVDLSWQTKLQGYQIGFCNDAKAVHMEGHSMSGLTEKKFYYILKNRLYIILKNFSFKSIIKKILPIIILIFLDSIFYSIKFKSIRYFISMIFGIGWNLINIDKIMSEREIIQKSRLISDKQLEQDILNYSIEYSEFIKKCSNK